jgi:glycosyltransferase involved in cell wall biosynthesis
MIKVLRVIYDLQIGGVQRMLLQSLPLLGEQGVESEICCLKKEGNLAEAFSKQGIPVHIIPFHSRLDPIGLVRLRRFILKNNFQIVHGHMYASNMAVNVALIGAGKVRVVNGYHSSHPFHSRSQERMAKWTGNIPDRFIAVSQSVKDALVQNGVDENRITIIHNGVIPPKQMTPVPEREPSDPLQLVWAGRFVKQKRVDMLVDLVRACTKEDIPVHLTLVGDGPSFQRMKKMIEDMELEKWITLSGWKEDIRPFIRSADLYVSASNREGFPNTLLEVCAEGRGFLVSDIPPNAEVLGSHHAGFLLGDNLSDWTRILKRLRENHKEIEALSHCAFEIGEIFSIEQTCRKTIGLYGELI